MDSGGGGQNKVFEAGSWGRKEFPLERQKVLKKRLRATLTLLITYLTIIELQYSVC